MIAADSRTVWLRDTVTVVSNRTGPVTLRGILMDITAQKAAEDAALRMQRILFAARAWRVVRSAAS
jgi:hypothetical protein